MLFERYFFRENYIRNFYCSECYNSLRDENTRINETNRNLRDENTRINEINRNLEITINQLRDEKEEINKILLDNEKSLEKDKKN